MRITRLYAMAACLAIPAFAGTIGGTFEGTSTLTPTGTPGVFTQSFGGDGNDVGFGAFTPASTSTIDFSHPPGIAITGSQFTMTFVNGSLIGNGSGSGTATGLGTATFTIELVFTGGTGIFTGYTGEATLTGKITQTSPTTESITNGTYTGSIAAPEPQTLVLMVSAFAGFLTFRKRRAAAA